MLNGGWISKWNIQDEQDEIFKMNKMNIQDEQDEIFKMNKMNIQDEQDEIFKMNKMKYSRWTRWNIQDEKG